MALSISPNAFNLSYTSFNKWRTALAQAAKITWPASWDSLASEAALRVLLCHSDCDGEIAPADASRLADRLQELMPLISDDWQLTTKNFIDGARCAMAAGEPMVFT